MLAPSDSEGALRHGDSSRRSTSSAALTAEPMCLSRHMPHEAHSPGRVSIGSLCSNEADARLVGGACGSITREGVYEALRWRRLRLERCFNQQCISGAEPHHSILEQHLACARHG